MAQPLGRLDFLTYLERSLRNPFVIDLRDRTLLEVVNAARRTFVTVNILRGKNIHAVKRCTGHSDLRHLEGYVRDED